MQFSDLWLKWPFMRCESKLGLLCLLTDVSDFPGSCSALSGWSFPLDLRVAVKRLSQSLKGPFMGSCCQSIFKASVNLPKRMVWVRHHFQNSFKLKDTVSLLIWTAVWEAFISECCGWTWLIALEGGSILLWEGVLGGAVICWLLLRIPSPSLTRWVPLEDIRRLNVEAGDWRTRPRNTGPQGWEHKERRWQRKWQPKQM